MKLIGSSQEPRERRCCLVLSTLRSLHFYLGVHSTTSMQHSLPTQYHYVRIAVAPVTGRDALGLRKAVQDALTQTFGVTSAALYVDFLWVAEDGGQFVIRVQKDDASKILAAIVASDAPKLSLVKESPFLPSLISVDEPL
ncbi:hypothetical protein D9615_007892 [Tricholomella constricta]|uniref:Ribonucleases P/MRP subunit Pop8-like domain-containing protein n=1 Tax=Tricholomella constricta TaxID=117010 RepID=A0A8H5M0U5_9AGAR|nr:hypothetical protein D9615_007892 [Tricholomella constricta]